MAAASSLDQLSEHMTTMTAFRQYVRRLLQPGKVRVVLPDSFEATHTLELLTEKGRDQIAVELAARGWNSFEKPVPGIITSAAKQIEGLFFDVGANTGLYALLAACACRHLAVHAFEPYPPALDALQRNIVLNRMDNRINICPSALGESPGRKSLYIPLQNHGLIESSASLNAGFKSEHSGTIDIDVTTIDAYVAGLQPATVGLLKIDVESTEHQVLAGGLVTIERDRPLIVLEVLHLADHAWLDVFCSENRYRIFTLHQDGVEPRRHVDFHGDAWNQCFCPEEKLPVLQSCAEECGLTFRT